MSGIGFDDEQHQFIGAFVEEGRQIEIEALRQPMVLCQALLFN